MYKRINMVLPVALFSCALVAQSETGIEPPNPADWTQGRWEVQFEKSTFCRPTPQASEREIFDAGWGLISVHWTGITAEGEPVDARYVWRYDGEKYPASIMEPAAEAISWQLVTPQRVEFTHWSRDDEITEELLRTVSDDGQEMTQTRAYLGGDEECVDVQVFRRKPHSRTSR